MSEPYQTQVDVSQLLINLENPRYDVLANQREALIAVIEDQGEKLLNLAKDICQKGTSPLDLIAVTPLDETEEKFIVLEGNRRITAIKLLLEDSLIDDLINNSKLKKQFKALSNQIDPNEISLRDCVVFPEASQADAWVQLKHTGQNQGVGTVQWDAKAIARFKERFGEKSIALQVLDLYKESTNLDEATLEKINKLPITTLARLINDPYVRDTIGIKKDSNGLIHLAFPKEQVLKPLERIFSDLSEKKINVNDVYYKVDRIDYLSSFDRSELPEEVIEEVGNDQASPLETDIESTAEKKTKNTSNELSQITPASENKNLKFPIKEKEKKSEKPKKEEATTKKRSKRSSHSRKALIPSRFTLKIEPKRLNSIYRELRRLEVDDYVNAVAVLFRVFLEGSVDHYIEVQLVPKNRKKGNRYSLANKIQDVCDFMETGKILSKNHLKAPRTAASTEHGIFSTATLNAYVHNRHFSPNPGDVKITWDNMSKFIETLWSVKLS